MQSTSKRHPFKSGWRGVSQEPVELFTRGSTILLVYYSPQKVFRPG